MTQFHVVRVRDGEDDLICRNGDGSGHRVFDNGRAAAEYAQDMRKQHPDYRYIPRPIREANSDWRQRQLERLANGHYKLVPWPSPLTTYTDHFLHISTKDPEKVAFTESPEKGERDIQTQLSPGKYLTRFFPNLSPDSVRHYANMVGADHLEFKIAMTVEEITEVYVNGPKSCMSGKMGGDFSGGLHPVAAYATGDFGVAYLERHGSITARSVVVPERKLYVDIYGDYDRLSAALKNAGYRRSDRRDDFLGLKLKAIKRQDEPYRDRPGYWVRPHLDFPFYDLRHEGEYLIVVD